MFSIEMLPAREGDCLWIRYGNGSPHQILIDGGRAATYKELKPRLAALPASEQTFELFIVTHVDRDHIEGALALLEDTSLNVKFNDIWFNGFDHLVNPELEVFGAVQGERLTKALLDRGLPWNAKWSRKAVWLKDPPAPAITLNGGLKITLLSPDRQKLKKLEPKWVAECEAAGIIPGEPSQDNEPEGIEHFGPIDIEELAKKPFVKDGTEPNGSTIAVLAEFDSRRVLFAGDCHEDRLVQSLKSVNNGMPVPLDAFKIPHHGSEHNISSELLNLVDCPRFLISSNGNYFKHPTPTAMARIIKFGGGNKTIFFNYRTQFTEIWDNALWKSRYGYETVYPTNDTNGTLTLSL